MRPSTFTAQRRYVTESAPKSTLFRLNKSPISHSFLVSFAAVFRLVTSRNPPGLRDVTSLKTAAKETNSFRASARDIQYSLEHSPSF